MLSLYRESKAPVEIELKSTLESVLLLLSRRFSNLGVTVESNLPENLAVHGFPAELRQVFTNLLTNAAEAAGKGGVIQVTASHCEPATASGGLRREAGVLLEVTDHGPGVPESLQPSLFQPFFTTKGERGTGLGLWVSKGIITRHGGSLNLRSSTRPEDHGTTVEVFLAVDPVINPAGAT
jgi:signal transduction histidine kinase